MNNLFTITRERQGGVISWTDDQVTYIVEQYLNNNVSLAELGRRFKCTSQAVRAVLRKQNIQLKGKNANYPRNEYYFNQINTKEKAYWLGFLYADGCVHSNNNEISINITDNEHVEKFKQAIGAINHKTTITNDKRWKNAKTLYQFSIKDAQLHSDLEKWGCVPQKSLKIEKIPNIPRDFISHFIRGYFDGDGSLHFLQGTNNFRISFVGTKSFLQDIQKELNIIHLAQQQQQGNNSYYIQIMGRKQIVPILNYLYTDSTDSIRLDRKYKKYLECLKWAGASPVNS